MGNKTKPQEEPVKTGKRTLLILSTLWIVTNLCVGAVRGRMDLSLILSCVLWLALMLCIPRPTGWFMACATIISIGSWLLPGLVRRPSVTDIVIWVVGAGVAVVLIRNPGIKAYAARNRVEIKLIGITGPTGAGKTTALRTLEDMGVTVIDADAVYHELLTENSKLQTALTKRFGDIILDEEGKVDRKKLGDRVFENASALEELNRITHQFVGEEVNRRVDYAHAMSRSAAIDAIALVESGLGEKCTATVAVLAPEETRVRRIMAREGISEEYARKRVAAQKEDDFFRANCTYVLENTAEDTPESFAPRARTLFEQILNP